MKCESGVAYTFRIAPARVCGLREDRALQPRDPDGVPPWLACSPAVRARGSPKWYNGTGARATGRGEGGKRGRHTEKARVWVRRQEFLLPKASFVIGAPGRRSLFWAAFFRRRTIIRHWCVCLRPRPLPPLSALARSCALWMDRSRETRRHTSHVATVAHTSRARTARPLSCHACARAPPSDWPSRSSQPSFGIFVLNPTRPAPRRATPRV